MQAREAVAGKPGRVWALSVHLGAKQGRTLLLGVANSFAGFKVITVMNAFSTLPKHNKNSLAILRTPFPRTIRAALRGKPHGAPYMETKGEPLAHSRFEGRLLQQASTTIIGSHPIIIQCDTVGVISRCYS